MTSRRTIATVFELLGAMAADVTEGIMNNPTFGSYFYSNTKKDVVAVDGSSAGLRRQSVDVFLYLAENHDQVLSREEIQTEVWKHQSVTDDSLSQCISEIRKAIKDTDRSVLKTVPRRGYMLVADEQAQQVRGKIQLPETQGTPTQYNKSLIYIAASLILGTLVFGFLIPESAGPSKLSSATSLSDYSKAIDPPSISIITRNPEAEFVNTVSNSTRLALSRYQSVSVVDHDNATYSIRLSQIGTNSDKGVSLELLSNDDNELVYAEELHTKTNSLHDTAAKSLGTRVAGMIASPGGGAVSRHLLKTSKGKGADELTRSQCYAFGYGCTNCSGELDPITKIAEECLDNILQEDPSNPRAWGLQSTLYARQYLWSSALPEPQRSNLQDRVHLKKLAIAAATNAEKYSDGTDTSVYWGMAQAYAASCQIDKLNTVIDRGLQINPDDPSLLGAFGSRLAYSGDWDTGVGMINKALEIEPKHYQRWWLFAVAKRHYAQGNFEQALEVFRTAYDESNWLSHLQMAYTLPHLDRVDEAIEERKELERLYPSITIENVLQFYKTYCFEDSFLEKMKWALTAAGLPSRGSSDDLNNIRPPNVNIMTVNGFTTEYKDVGRGIPIVFVHGSISDYRAWSHYQNPVSENHRYISYSLRYAGSQEWPDEEGQNYGIATDAEDLIKFIEALGTGPVFTVSWSRGGRVSSLAALLRPELFQGNIHFEPIVGNLGNTENAALIKVRDVFNKRFDDSGNAFEAGDNELGAAIILENVFEVDRGDFELEIMPLRAMNRDSARNIALQVSLKNVQELNCEKLNKTQVPTLVVVGEKTNAWWKHVIQRYHECTKDSRLSIMPGVNHDGPIRRPEILIELILDFVILHSIPPPIAEHTLSD